MVSCGMSVVKYLLFVFNFVFLVTGIALIAVGAAVQVKAKDYFDFLSNQYTTAPVILIVIGVIIFLLSFFACCGAIKENHCMVMTFAVLLFIIFVIEIAAAIVAYVYKAQLGDYLKDGMNDGMKHYNESGYEGVTAVWDDVQKSLKCCGSESYEDWRNNSRLQDSVPDSCCKVRSPGCGKGEISHPTDNIYKTGCFEEIWDTLKKQTVIVGGVGIGLAFVQTVGIIFACCLANAIKKQYESV